MSFKNQKLKSLFSYPISWLKILLVEDASSLALDNASSIYFKINK